MIHYARLPVHVPLKKIQHEVATIKGQWNPHFNHKHYEGEWTVLSLRSPSGKTDQIIPERTDDKVYADTELMNTCPAIRKLMEGLQCPKMAVRLMNLKAGAFIKEHRDHDLAFEKGEARLHFPVFTNPLVEFFVIGEKVEMKEGDCLYVNVNLPHKVANHGSSDRVHLVVDCEVNNWLKHLFERAEKVESLPIQSREELQKMIFELRWQNTETSNRIAIELEQQLKMHSAAEN